MEVMRKQIVDGPARCTISAQEGLVFHREGPAGLLAKAQGREHGDRVGGLTDPDHGNVPGRVCVRLSGPMPMSGSTEISSVKPS
jgi:hypothetical protein